ncbi:MAG: flagellar basal-body MS-ring/collar protein FliF [Ketobacter sp.]|nr:MAG: flagellar basal body M-ring protein FliF [Ketobacter sp.]
MSEEKKESTGFAVLDGLGGLTIVKQIGLIVGLAAAISIGLWVVLWSQEPDFRPLYTDISHLEAGQVADILQREQIRFKVDTGSGMILVESDKIHQARMKLAAEGFPAGSTLGYELLDKEQAFGTSQFMEKTRYHRSIEGELARTISSMNRVRGARVHLAIPKRSVFVNDNRKPSASVFVELYPNQNLEKMQVASIIHLVASSIPELEDKHVTVVDQRGQLLSQTDNDSDIALAAKQLDYSKQMEQKYVERINSILNPLVGNDGFKVQVSADIDFNQTEQTSEYFSPDLPAVRSEQTLSEIVGGGATQGIPGALSNQPPGAVTAPEELATTAEAETANNGNVRKQATRNFELDRTISHTRHSVGAVKRLSVAVVLDDKLMPPPAGSEAKDFVRTALSDAELERIRVLVQDAVGFSAARGDSVTVVNQAFRQYANEEIVIPETPIWERPWFWDAVKRVGGILFVMFLFLAVLRPILKKLAENGQDDSMAALESQMETNGLAGASGAPGAVGEGASVTLSGSQNPLLPGPDASYNQHLDAVKSMVAEDPRRVAQVVKSWVANE